MRLTHSILAAALAASVAAPAAAKIDDSFSVDGELFWSIVDETAERSYTRDLGIGLQEFLNGVASGQEWSFANDANLTTFLAETASGNALVWNIGAVDGTGINRYLSTAVPGETLPVFTNQILGFFNDNPDIYIGASNSLESHISLDDGSHIATAADGPAYAGAATWGGNFGGRAQGFSNYIGASDPAALILFEQNSSAFAQRFNPGKTTGLQYAGNPYAASFNGSELTIAAIPEPSTYAMLGLGLAAIGFAARRRAAK
jgi:hypothetical protein